jgi:hypothetical protein
MRRIRFAALAVALALAAGCVADDEQPEPIDTAPPAAPAAPVSQAAPDTTAPALWAHLGSAGYESWPMFPGKGQLYQGAEPHGMLLTTYVNEVALQALRNRASMLPAGAILVKENYTPDSTLAAITVMHKVSGYDQANGSWFWAKYDTAGVPEVSGRATMCQDCHRGSQRDFIMTSLPSN